MAHELECIAYILVRKDQPNRAVMLLGAADHLRKLIESNPTPLELVEYEKELAVLRGKMDETEFERVWQDGERLSMDEAITLAVREE